MGNESEIINVPPQNSSLLPNLPEEIIKEILLRLPAKPLGRFRCVSKPWLFLLSSYEFAKAHLKFLSMNNIYEPERLVVGSERFLMDLYTCSLRSTTDNTIYTGSIHPDVGILSDVVRFGCPIDHIHGAVVPVGSCNGLVCVVESSKTVILWNPTTRKYRVLPLSGTCLSFKNVSCRYAFGYDELHDDYKVVEVLNLAQGLSLSGSQAKVYSLRNDCWKTVLNWPNGCIISGWGVCLNGAIHWLVSSLWTPKPALLSYDLELEMIVGISPPVTEDYAVRFFIKVLGGCLSLCCEYIFYMDVWLLKEYGVVESWTKVVRIPFDMPSVRPKPLLLMADGKILLRYGSEMCLYDPIKPHTHLFFQEYTVHAFTYFESLVSPSLDDDIITGSTLPQYVITDILLRLPVKSLLRFKSVSKEWHFVISSSDFVKSHLKISTKNNVCIHDKLLFGSNTFPVNLYTCSIYSLFECSILRDSLYPATNENLPFNKVSFDCPFAESDEFVWLVGSCDGLVCVSLSSNIIILWNPTTRKSKLIPNSGTDLDLDFNYYGISYGFGYDEQHNDYKVVEILGFEDTPGVFETQVKVCSVRTNSWKVVPNWPGGDTSSGSGKFLNGAIHWSVWDLRTPTDWAIVSLDLATDAFALLTLPDIGYDDVRVNVETVNGCLAATCEHNVYMDIWVMTEYGMSESWTILVRIPFFLDFRVEHVLRPRPLFLLEGKVLINYGSSIRVFDLHNSESHQFSTRFGAEATTFSESLVWPDVDDEIIHGRALPQEINTELLLCSNQRPNGS